MRARLVAAIAFVLASFALNSLVTRLVVSRALLDPGLVTWARFAAGALALLVVSLVARSSWRVRSAWPIVWLGAYAVLISYGYGFIAAAAGTFVFYAFNLATLIIGGRRHAPRALVGGALALVGVGVLALGRVDGTTLLGVAMLAGTGIAWGLYTLRARQATEPLAFTTAAFVGLTLVLTVPAGALVATRHPIMTMQGWALTLLMGAVTTALAYVVWSWTVARIGTAQAGAYQLAIPVLTAAGAIAFLGEPFSWRLVLAGALVLAGMALATPRLNRMGRMNRTPRTP